MLVQSAPTPAEALADLDATFLPVGPMRQVARVTAVDSRAIAGEVDLTDHWAFAVHFPGDPIFPGVLMVEAAGQLVALWAWAHGRRGRPRLVRTAAIFVAPVGPASALLVLEGEVRRRQHLHFATVRIQADGATVATVELVLAVLPADS